MTTSRRGLLAGATALLIPDATRAQAWPTRPVRLISGGAPGSVPDVIARMVADGLGSRIGQPVVVENRPGAGGITAIQAMLGAAPDGHALALATVGQVVLNSYLFRSLPYDPMRDLLPVSPVVSSAMAVAVNADVKATTLGELLALMKAAPGRLFVATPAIGTPPHLIALLLLRAAGVDATMVPYTTGPEALQALMRGDVQMMVDGPTLMAPQIRAGKIRALAVTSPSRSVLLPDVPTVAEAGLAAAEAGSWMGIMGQATLPAALAGAVDGHVQRMLAEPTFRERVEKLGFLPMAGSQGDFPTRIRADHARWAAVIRESGVTLGE